MKTYRSILAVLLTLFLGGLSSFAQENYGDNPTKCTQELSNYSEYFKQNNFKDAYPSWSWCLNNCPKSLINIYVQGTTIVEYLIGAEQDPVLKEKWIDTLMFVYDKRIEHFGQEGLVIGRKGNSALKYYPNDKMGAYNMFKRSFELSKGETESFVLEVFMQLSVILFNNNQLTKEDVLTNYSLISEEINKQITAEQSPDRKVKKEATAQKIEDYFVSSGVADCEVVIKMFAPKFEENPKDLELAKKIITLLDMGNSDDCKLSDLYLKAATLLYENEKSAKAALSLAQSYLKRKDAENSKKYYLEAINLESDAVRKSDYYYELALVYFRLMNSYQAARDACRSALASNPNCGKAYMLIGNIYAVTAKNCVKDNRFEKKAVNCLIVDQFIKARNADPSLAAEANQAIARYSANFPTNEDAFWAESEVHEGATFTIGCWIQETTTIRFSD